MNTRMDKYYKERSLEESRTSRNKEKYNKSFEDGFENLNLTSNISIIDADTKNLDIEQLKAILDEKYANNKSRKTLEEEQTETPEDFEDTKEYDLKKVIDEAHKNKNSDYDKERFKKLRETQFDILNSLNLDRDEDPVIEESLTVEEANLMNLIKTVNENELKKEQIESKEDNLLSDLEGNGNTEVLDPISLEDEEETFTKKPTILEELEKTKQLSKKDIMNELEKEETKSQKIEIIEEDINENKTEKINDPDEFNNSFYTGKFQIKQSDLDEFADLQKEMTSGSAVIKILLALLVLIIIAAAVYLLNKYMNLGLF